MKPSRLQRLATLVAVRHIEAGAPARERQRMAQELYRYVLKNAHELRVIDDIFQHVEMAKMGVPVDEVLGLDQPERLYIRFYETPENVKRKAGGFYKAPNKITVYLKTGQKLEDLQYELGDARLKSILIHEITHYLDDRAGALHLGDKYEGAGTESYYKSPAEMSAIISQVTESVQSALLRKIRKTLRTRASLDDLLFDVPMLSGYNSSFYFEDFFKNRSPLSDYLSGIDQSLVKKLGVHLGRRERQRFLKQLYQSLEESRRRVLLPAVKKAIARKPELLENENDEDYLYREGPGRRGAEAWWKWLLSQSK